jgi:hypothetical protein
MIRLRGFIRCSAQEQGWLHAVVQDHPACLSAFYLTEEAGPISVTDELLHSDGRIRLRAILKYALFRKGPLATTGCDHGAFVSTTGEQLLQPCQQRLPLHGRELPLLLSILAAWYNTWSLSVWQ